MNDVIITSEQLPSTISELTKFALVGRDKLKAVKAEIHAIDKLQLAQEVKEQKLREGQEIAEVVTDAECKIGELIREIPKATKDNNPSGLKKNTQISSHVDLGYAKPKSAVLKENGISQRQAEHFQMMAKHPESVARAKERAREKGEVLSRSAVLDQITRDTFKAKKPKQEAKEAKARHEEFQRIKAESDTVSFRDLREDAKDVRTIGRDFFDRIEKITFKVHELTLFRDDTDIEAAVKAYSASERAELGRNIDKAIAVLNFIKRKIVEGI